MRPTDVCHLNQRRAPVPRAFPALALLVRASFDARLVRASCDACLHRRIPLDSLAPWGFTGGTGCFTTSETASADRNRTHLPCLFARLLTSELVIWLQERGRFLPTAPFCDRASDTFVAPELFRRIARAGILRELSRQGHRAVAS